MWESIISNTPAVTSAVVALVTLLSGLINQFAGEARAIRSIKIYSEIVQMLPANHPATNSLNEILKIKADKELEVLERKVSRVLDYNSIGAAILVSIIFGSLVYLLMWAAPIVPLPWSVILWALLFIIVLFWILLIGVGLPRTLYKQKEK